MAAAGGVELRWPAAAVAARWSGCNDPEEAAASKRRRRLGQAEAAARQAEEAAARVSGSGKKLGSDYHVRGIEWIVVQWMIVLLHMGYII
jgi:hypothetical protein